MRCNAFIGRRRWGQCARRTYHSLACRTGQHVKIIVTGGAGFIGSAVCRFLIEKTPHHVINVDKLTYATNLNSLAPVSDDPRYAFVQADIIDREAMDAMFARHQPDAIMHLAAESHVDRSLSGSDAFIQTNIVGTQTLLEAARSYWMRLNAPEQEAFRFLHVSTDEVYGSLGDQGLFEETTPYDPSSPYAASKAAADHLASAWHRSYGLPVVISNCSNNYGPYHFPEKLIPLIILNALEGRDLPVYGDGSNVRDWLFVEDHAAALYAIVTSGLPGEKYNVGGNCERSNLDVVNGICDVLDDVRPQGASRRDLIKFVADRPGHDQRYAIDASKIQRDLGWAAHSRFRAGVGAHRELVSAKPGLVGAIAQGRL